MEAVSLAKMEYSSGDASELPPDTNYDTFPDHLGDRGNPNAMKAFFSGVLKQPMPNTGYAAANQGIGWKSVEGWLPSGDRYYYYFDGDGDGNYSSAVDSRIYYEPSSGRIVQDAWGAGAI